MRKEHEPRRSACSFQIELIDGNFNVTSHSANRKRGKVNLNHHDIQCEAYQSKS